MWHFLKVTSNKCCQLASLRLSAEPFCGKHGAAQTSVALSQSVTARAQKIKFLPRSTDKAGVGHQGRHAVIWQDGKAPLLLLMPGP